jgi:hypothetical protein
MSKLWSGVIGLVFVLSAASSWGQSSEESAAKAAEQTGKLREALTNYVAALQKTPEGSADDQRLRETIIKLVQKLSPPPAVPEEARRFSVRGQVWVKEAKSPSDFDEAAKEFGKALRVAPWWADGYINQGVALEKARKFSDAARALKLYLLAAPNAPDAQNVRDQIYALELREEKAQKESVAAREEQERKRREEEARASDPARLAGEWCILHPSGELWCSGHIHLIKVSGNSFEIWNDYITGGGSGPVASRVQFRGTIRGDDLIGSYIPSIYSISNCPGQPMPMQGKIVAGRNRIELSYSDVGGLTRDCVVTSTRPASIVLVKKPSY